MLLKVALVGLGGFIGAILRYGVSGWAQSISKNSSFPIGTLTVNLIGCFIIGILFYLAQSRGIFSPEWRLVLFVGLLGAFTTFSTFGNETLLLVQNSEMNLALLNIGLHLILGLIAVWGGQLLGKMIGG